MLVVNHKTYKQPPLEVYLEDVYNGTEQDSYIIGPHGQVGKRKTVNLTQDPVFKNQFYNEELNLVVRCKNEITAIVLRDENGKLLPFVNYTVSPEYCSIIFEGEPKVKPATVEAVFYIGLTESSVLMNDGSTQMTDNYQPVKDKDIVTKDYVEKLVGNKAGLFPIEFSIVQDEKLLPELIYYQDNRKYPVIITKPGSIVKITTNEFIVDNTMTNPYISIKFGDIELFKESLSIVLSGTSLWWKCIKSKNISQDENLNVLYWKNMFEIEFDAGQLSAYVDIVKQDTLTLQVATYNSKITASMPFGLDKYINPNDIIDSCTYRPTDLATVKTHWVSGEAYVDESNLPAKLPIRITTKSPYHYFRPEVVGCFYWYSSTESIHPTEEFANGYQELKLVTSLVDSNPVFEDTIVIDEYVIVTNCDAIAVKLNTAFGESQTLHFPISLTTSGDDELERVEGPLPNVFSPELADLKPWDSTKPLLPTDLKKLNGAYYGQQGQLYVKVEGKDFSHIELDAIYDGEVLVKVAGETGWLATTAFVNPFTTPKINFEQCKLKEEGSTKIFTFGKVSYSGTVYLRFMDCNFVKINSMKLL